MNAHQVESSVAQDLAGKAILLEIGAKAGILEWIENESYVTISQLAKELKIQEDFLKNYLDVLESLQLLAKQHVNGQVAYSKTPHYQIERNKIGYITWGMGSCFPLIENTRAFTSDFESAVRQYHRCGEHVARTSKWMGETDFYPHAENTIIRLNPKKVVDLGSGTCGLLMRLAKKINGMHGIGVDLSKDACEKAREYIQQQSLTDRIEVIEAPIQELVKNETVFVDVDVVHAGFVFHDLLPDEEDTLDYLLACIRNTAPKASLVIVDAVPFAQNSHERAFSSAFTFLHKFFMGRKLLSEADWQTKIKKVGFKNIQIEPLGISGGRIFVAS